MAEYRSIAWVNGKVRLLDQRGLPGEVKYLDYTDHYELAKAIRDMVIRGAPAIGAAAAYGLALAAQNSKAGSISGLLADLDRAAADLHQSRPTAANLAWSVNRILEKAKQATSPENIRQVVLREADAIAKDDEQINRQIGLNGLRLIPDPASIIHHCNTGALATVGYGTALGVIRAAFEYGKRVHVFVDETRPRLQGARLTAWELQQLGIPHTVIVDGAAGYFMLTKQVDLCIVGCDRVAANGDTANKVGTYTLALAAFAHGIPFYVAGPTSTIDLNTRTGEDIPVEMRSEDEVTHIGETQITPAGTKACNPAFDITPARYITAIITEGGVIYPPYGENLTNLIK